MPSHLFTDEQRDMFVAAFLEHCAKQDREEEQKWLDMIMEICSE